MGVVPASLQLLLLHCFPESPRYLLIERNDIFGATAGEGVSWGGDWLWEVLVAGPRSPKTKAHPSSILSHPYLTGNHSPYGSALLSHPVALQHFQGADHHGVRHLLSSYELSPMGQGGPLGRLSQGRAKALSLPCTIPVNICSVMGRHMLVTPALPAALHRFLGTPNVQDVIEEMKEEQQSLSSMEMVSVWQLLRDRSVRWQTLSVVVVNAGMQLSGIDAVSPAGSSSQDLALQRLS